MGSSMRTLLTTYGFRELETASLHGSAVLYLMADHVIPEGTMWDGYRKLIGQVRWRRGTVLMPRLLSDGSGKFLWSAFRYGIYEALRSIMHTKRHYAGWNDEEMEIARGETLIVEDVREALSQALAILSLRPNLTVQERDALREVVRKQATQIGNVRDLRKQRALVRMLNAQRERDSRGRNNPSARMAILVGAQDDLQDRLDLIRYIEPRIGSREMALLLEAARIKRLFSAAYKRAEEARDGYRLSNRNSWATSMASVRRDLETIKVGPYPAHIERLSADLCEAEDAMRHFITATVKEKLQIVMESLRCKRARRHLEELIVRMALAEREAKRKPSKKISAEQRKERAKAAAGQFVREVADLGKRMQAGINDTGFKKPVRALACGDLVEAEVRLSLPEKPDLRGAKACAQRAARRL